MNDRMYIKNCEDIEVEVLQGNMFESYCKVFDKTNGKHLPNRDGWFPNNLIVQK